MRGGRFWQWSKLSTRVGNGGSNGKSRPSRETIHWEDRQSVTLFGATGSHLGGTQWLLSFVYFLHWCPVEGARLSTTTSSDSSASSNVHKARGWCQAPSKAWKPGVLHGRARPEPASIAQTSLSHYRSLVAPQSCVKLQQNSLVLRATPWFCRQVHMLHIKVHLQNDSNVK